MAKLPKFPKGKIPKDLNEEKPKKRARKRARVIAKGEPQTKKHKGKKVRMSTPRVRHPRVPKPKTRKKRVAHPVLTRTRANVKATINRAEKRGFRFTDELKEYVKQASLAELRALQKNKYKALYEQSTAIGKGGYIISGIERRLEEVRESALKGAETRRRNKKLDIISRTIKEAQERVVYEEPSPTEQAQQDLSDIYETPDELYYEPEVIENEPTFEAEERARQLEFQQKKDEKAYQTALDLGDVAWDTINDIISDYEKLGAGRFGQYFKDMMLYYEKRYSVDTIKYAISMVYEDYLEIAQDIIFYNNNIYEMINSVNNLKRLIDQALVYSGLTPDFEWEMSFDELKDKETLDFLSSEEYPY